MPHTLSIVTGHRLQMCLMVALAVSVGVERPPHQRQSRSVVADSTPITVAAVADSSSKKDSVVPVKPSPCSLENPMPDTLGHFRACLASINPADSHAVAAADSHFRAHFA